MIKVSVPGKIHLLGEHTVVYGKPALLAAINLRVAVTLKQGHSGERQRLQNQDPGCASLTRMTNVIEPIIKKHLKVANIPPYQLNISSEIPLGVGLGSSAAISAAYITALLTFLGIKWDLKLINDLTYEAEKIFHGNPSGGDNSTVVFGGLVWFRKESPDLKIIQPLPFSIPSKLAKNFVLINTGKPKETTKEMVEMVSSRFTVHGSRFKKIFDDQERLTRELLTVLQEGDEKALIQIIRTGEKNLEDIGAVSPSVKSIIRKIEKTGGAAKICGGGGKTGPTGILLCYHPDVSVIKNIANSYKLEYIKTNLGVAGLRKE